MRHALADMAKPCAYRRGSLHAELQSPAPACLPSYLAQCGCNPSHDSSLVVHDSPACCTLTPRREAPASPATSARCPPAAPQTPARVGRSMHANGGKLACKHEIWTHPINVPPGCHPHGTRRSTQQPWGAGNPSPHMPLSVHQRLGTAPRLPPLNAALQGSCPACGCAGRPPLRDRGGEGSPPRVLQLGSGPPCHLTRAMQLPQGSSVALRLPATKRVARCHHQPTQLLAPPTCHAAGYRLQRCRQVIGMRGQQLAVRRLQAGYVCRFCEVPDGCHLATCRVCMAITAAGPPAPAAALKPTWRPAPPLFSPQHSNAPTCLHEVHIVARHSRFEQH